MANDIETHFQKPGSIEPPRFIGRLVRLLLGMGCLHLTWQLVGSFNSILNSAELIKNSTMWFPLALGFILIPYVVNIGLGLNTKRWPQITIVILSAVLMAFYWFNRNTLGGVIFNAFTLVWMIYTFVHLGVSFVLSAIIKTPGCEMRAIPHAYTLLTGKSTQEHYCPGFLHQLDQWEQKNS